MSLIVQLGTTVVSKTGSSVTNAAGGRNISYRDSRVTTQSSPAGAIVSNASNIGTMSSAPQHRTIMTAVATPATVRTAPTSLNTSNVAAGALKIQSQHHRVISSTQHAQVSVVQKSQSSAAIQKPAFMELQTRKVIVPATANCKLSSELVKETSVEKQLQSSANDDKKLHQSQIPLMYQYVLQEHNYVALPPASPPLSPMLHHNAGGKLNGAQSSASPSSMNIDPLAQHHPQHHAPYHGQLAPHNQLSKSTGLLTMRQSAHAHHSPHHGVSQAPHPTRLVNHVVDDAGSDISSDAGREIEPEGEETETAPEAEGEDDSVTRCICDFEHDDGYMICCDKCSVWQHVDCMGIDRMNIPDEYMCERCQPRRVDKMRARNIQCRKREEFFHNDSSSDSSSSSTDSEPLTIITSGAVNKKRSGPGPGSRRKNEPLRKQTVGNVGYRQRRDSARDNVPSLPTPRRQPTPRKKSTENKRAPRRRKSKGADEDKSPESWDKSPPLQSLRQWIDNYEEAVTNHYSPELRARIQSIRVNGVHSELKVPSHLLSGSSTGVAKCRLTMLPNGTKILVTSCSLAANQPIIELRGKYMLSHQHRALSARNTPPPGPFLFFHRLPLPALREATEVCVDCRTYGNDARFVRRSCKPNSEVRHCVEKGTLHLFLVTLCNLDKNAEITIRHQEGANLPCCCGNPRECSAQSQIAAQTSSIVNKKNGTQEESTRRRRGRRRTVSSSYGRDLPSPSGRTPPSPPDAISPSMTPTTPATPASVGSPPHSPIPEKKRRLSPPGSPIPPKVKEEVQVKDEVKAEPMEEEPLSDKEKFDKPEKNLKVEKVVSSPSPPPTPPTTRNTMARRSSTVNRLQLETDSVTSSRRTKDKEREREKERKDEEKPGRERRGRSESETEQKNVSVKNEPVDKNKNRALTREERKMEAIMKAFERMEKMAQKKQEAQVRQQRQKSGEKNDEQDIPVQSQRKEVPNVDRTRRRKRKGRGRSLSSTHSKDAPQATTRSQRRTRLYLRGSGRVHDVEQEEPEEADPDDISSDEEIQSPPSMFHDLSSKTPPPSCDKDGGSCSSQGSTPPTPLSSACLLVAAAVGPLAPGFKFPKTKKGLLTSWFKTPDGGSTPEPGKTVLPYMKPLSPEGVNNNLVSSGSGSAGFAKKRWLRQAISEDHCDSPIGRAGSGDAVECVTPLKKRRLARESMSAEQDSQLADSPANQESESDQPTQDEDTLDGTMPTNENADTEISSPDDGSQSAEDVEVPHANNQHGPSVFESGLSPATSACPEQERRMLAYENAADDDLDLHLPKTLQNAEDAVVSTTQGPTDPRKPRDSVQKLQSVLPSPSLLRSAAHVAPPPMAVPPVPQPPEPPAIKRKLSISEYRQRKQRTSTDTATTKSDTSPSLETMVVNNTKPRSRSSSTSSTSSSLSSDDESSTAPIMNKIRQLDMRAAKVGAFASAASSVTTAIPGLGGGSIVGLNVDPVSLARDGDGEDKKVGSSWSSAPTLVERQRENLTERLRREFGLFVDDEEAERARKQALLAAGGDPGKDKDLSPVAVGKKKGTLPPPPPPGLPPAVAVGGFLAPGAPAPAPAPAAGAAPPPPGISAALPPAPAPSAPFSNFNAGGKSSTGLSGQFFPPASGPAVRPTTPMFYPPFSRP